jgi:hypothetical protein
MTPRNQLIADRVKAGETFAAIALDYGVSSQRIRQIALHRGVRSVRWFSLKDSDLTRFDRKRALDLYDRGMPFAHISEIIGCHPTTVMKFATKYRGYNPSPCNGLWTEKEIAFVRAHYKRPGWSATRIGLELRRTRHEVIGKAWRLRRDDAKIISQRAA